MDAPRFLFEEPTGTPVTSSEFHARLNTNFNVDNPHSDQGFDVENVVKAFRDQVNEISAQQDAATSKRNDLLEAILNELKGIRQDQVIIKEALLYAPGGPGADQARQSFEARQK